MKKISLRNCNGIPLISSISGSAFTFRAYSSCHYSKKTISVKDKLGVNSSNLDDAVTLFHQMMKHYSAVISLFRQMRKLGIPISDFILNSMINSYCLMYRVDCAFSVLPIYLKKDIPFDVVTFNTLLRGLFSENKVKDAVELFKKLVRDKICEPNQIMYGTIMNGLSKRGHTQKTLNALCKDGNLDAAINILSEMKQKGIHLDIFTYNSLIDGLCKLGQWEKVKTLFSEMVKP
ncbi:hypothetical protein R3W88_015957 [Solanum pinnatisectum]|uniref:Pentatricopeptide repeat-containing protein n=1 Tax=Solanum pinnatisectum TaxID=50273 RepID=A0AAV9KYF0_9SOLN|nr:hypothetical protein R3W88_015957 [Solanum pinnatisectum]